MTPYRHTILDASLNHLEQRADSCIARVFPKSKPTPQASIPTNLPKQQLCCVVITTWNHVFPLVICDSDTARILTGSSHGIFSTL